MKQVCSIWLEVVLGCFFDELVIALDVGSLFVQEKSLKPREEPLERARTRLYMRSA